MCLQSQWQHIHELLGSNSTLLNGIRGFPQSYRPRTPRATATCTPTVNGVWLEATQRFQLIHRSKLCTYVNSEHQVTTAFFVSSTLKMEAPRSSKSCYLPTKMHMKPIASDFISSYLSSFKFAFLTPSFSFVATVFLTSRQMVNHEMLQNLVYLQV
jgi:hypothetical protein